MAFRLSHALLVIALASGSSVASGSDFSPLAGITFNTGAAVAEESEGAFAELSAFIGFFGASVEAKRLGDDEVNGAFLALGLTYVLQAQVGETNHGTAYRFKSEFTPLGVFFPRSSAALSAPERITVSLGYERIPDARHLSNYSIGIGYVFN